MHGQASKFPLAVLHLVQQEPPPREIHGTPVIRIHEGKIPELRPLVNVGHPGRSDLEEDLCEAVQRPVMGNLVLEAEEIRKEPVFTPGFQERGHEVAHGRFVVEVRMDPMRETFASAPP
jgi:hypothetical protein